MRSKTHTVGHTVDTDILNALRMSKFTTHTWTSRAEPRLRPSNSSLTSTRGLATIVCRLVLQELLEYRVEKVFGNEGDDHDLVVLNNDDFATACKLIPVYKQLSFS